MLDFKKNLSKDKIGGKIMEFNRCSRCGSFYISEGNVCPKCSTKDGFEFSNFHHLNQ